jgi:hypothetical protein
MLKASSRLGPHSKAMVLNNAGRSLQDDTPRFKPCSLILEPFAFLPLAFPDASRDKPLSHKKNLLCEKVILRFKGDYIHTAGHFNTVHIFTLPADFICS